MKKFLLFSICCYQKAAQYWHELRGTSRRPICPFYPSCSRYSYAAIKQHGIMHGVAETAWRVLRCHPWQKGGVDPVRSS